MEPNTVDSSKHTLAQPLRRVMELSELHEGDIVLFVANLAPESEDDARYWQSTVSTVKSSVVESEVHYAGPTWAVRLEENPEGYIIADVMDPNERANGAFASEFWVVQLYLLRSVAEITAAVEEKE